MDETQANRIQSRLGSMIRLAVCAGLVTRPMQLILEQTCQAHSTLPNSGTAREKGSPLVSTAGVSILDNSQSEYMSSEDAGQREIDLFVSFAPRPVLKRAPTFSSIDPEQASTDLRSALASRLHGSIISFETNKPDVSREDLSSCIEGAKVFLALSDERYFNSRSCLEQLEYALSLHSENRRPQILSLSLDSEADTASRMGYRLKSISSVHLPLAASDADGDLDREEEEYRSNIERAADHIAALLNEQVSASPFSSDFSAEFDRDAPDRPIWLVQYKARDARGLQARLEPGRKETWRIGRYDPDRVRAEMRIGDWVAVWRTVAGKDRGGIIAWAKVSSLDPLDDGLFEMSLVEAFADKPVGRDGVLAELSGKPRNWPGELSLKRLDPDESEVFARYLPEATGETLDDAQDEVETPLSDDSPETTRDLLRRGPLAFALAHKINDIWGEQNGAPSGRRASTAPRASGQSYLAGLKASLREASERSALRSGRHAPRPAFILHIDAPWGGGKTTFANYISRFLNPGAYGIEPRQHFRSDPESIFHDAEMHDPAVWPTHFAKRKWITVEFNAWRHQHVSPPWWDLYEVIRKECLATLPIWQDRLSRQVRELRWRVATPAFRTRAIVFAVVVFLAIAFFVFAKSYDVDEALGLKEGETLLSVVVTLVAGGSGWALIGAMQNATKELVASAGDSTDAINLGTSDPLRRFRRHFAASIAEYDHPVMVIIDDLDRCDPNYVVELVRGLLTVFQSPRLVFVLLGDKHWIETAFSEEYAKMAKAHSDPNVSFGGRFAEKAIQMSFVLPEANPDERNRYVERLLLGETQTGAKAATDRVRERVAQLDSELDAVADLTAKQAVLESYAQDIGTATEESEELRNIVNSRKVIYGAAAGEKQEEVIRRHALAPLKDMLPVNPRRIKRLVNMIAIYQASAQAALGIEPREKRWKQMVLWVVLMSEYPAHWRLLCADPRLAGYVLTTLELPKGHAKNEELAGALAKLSHPAVLRLIHGLPFDAGREDDPDGPVERSEYALDPDAIRLLRRLTPTN